MSQLIRHIAGVPTATEQRCVRCCAVIASPDKHIFAAWPGRQTVSDASLLMRGIEATDCTAVDLTPLQRDWAEQVNRRIAE